MFVGRPRLYGLIVAALVFLPGFKATAAGLTCHQNIEGSSLPTPPSGFLGFFWSFESDVIAAFPLTTPASRLSSWMDQESFSWLSYGPFDTATIDEDDEIRRSSERVAAAKKINSRFKEIRTWCGVSYFSVAWNSDGCGNVTEVFADEKICVMDILP
ncbi:hypothetical protein [Rhizobium changzhiense]|uniref:DUF1311 domain-containing protein n=1 Tax=Rhizobium changzhiense TaxID=2692317 RepID=A0ABR6AC89_9HYPH|nr:hypothetical protein [Rhizobium changzhiense]MBA5804207.1 hypothetical protein [Rhizobium changzhiense]